MSGMFPSSPFSNFSCIKKLTQKFSYLTLQIEPTRECNLNCKICVRRHLEEKRGFLSFEHFKQILDAYNFRFVGLHGWGEPLLNPELFDMLRYAKSQGVITNLTTNGTLVEDHVMDIFDSGVNDLAFGIYRVDFLDRFQSGLEKLLNERSRRNLKTPKIYFDITIYRDNLDEIFDLIEIAMDLGVDAVILHRLFNIYRVDGDVEYITKEEEEKLFQDVRNLSKEEGYKIYLPRKHTLPCIYVKKCIFVTWDGKVTPCCYLPDYSMGNGLNDDFKTVLRERSKFIKNMHTHPVCSKCIW